MARLERREGEVRALRETSGSQLARRLVVPRPRAVRTREPAAAHVANSCAGMNEWIIEWASTISVTVVLLVSGSE